MSSALALPVVIPLLAAALSLAALRNLTLQRIVGITASSALVGVAGWLLVAADGSDPAAGGLGGWEAPFGIALDIRKDS